MTKRTIIVVGCLVLIAGGLYFAGRSVIRWRNLNQLLLNEEFLKTIQHSPVPIDVSSVNINRSKPFNVGYATFKAPTYDASIEWSKSGDTAHILSDSLSIALLPPHQSISVNEELQANIRRAQGLSKPTKQLSDYDVELFLLSAKPKPIMDILLMSSHEFEFHISVLRLKLRHSHSGSGGVFTFDTGFIRGIIRMEEPWHDELSAHITLWALADSIRQGIIFKARGIDAGYFNKAMRSFLNSYRFSREEVQTITDSHSSIESGGALKSAEKPAAGTDGDMKIFTTNNKERISNNRPNPTEGS